MTELLAPAGSMEALHAAISNGANAVYLGGKSFSARAFADNFTLEEIAQAVKTAHFHNVKVYVAVNTLVADSEIVALLMYASELYKAGVDAVIIQDIGLIDLLQKLLPGLCVHASTQMGIHNSAGLRLLSEHGISRVILPRELSFEQMRALRQNSPVELECFVHGALCISFSGQCLFSSMVGGRSGNRGRCAQPCRMAYRLVDEYGDDVTTKMDGKYLLSPRDLFGYKDLEELWQLGIDSWKIEGRMKKPQYVAVVSRIYGNILSQLEQNQPICPGENDMIELMQVFNRDRCQAYWHGNPGSAMMSYTRPNNRGMFLGRISAAKNGMITIKLAQKLSRNDGIEIWQTGQREGCTVDTMLVDGIRCDIAEPGQTVQIPSRAGRPGDRVFKTYDSQLMESAHMSYLRLPEKPLSFYIQAKMGEQIKISVADEDGYFASCSSEYIVEAAQKKDVKPMDVAFSQLARLGGTGYFLASLKGVVDNQALLPASVLNQLRRRLVEDLLSQREATEQRTFDEHAFGRMIKQVDPAAGHRSKSAQNKAGFSVLVDNFSDAELAARKGFADIYFDIAGSNGIGKPGMSDQTNEQIRFSHIIPYLPQMIFPHQEAAIVNLLGKYADDDSVAAVVVNNLGQIGMLREMGWKKPIYGGPGLNVFNSQACKFLSEQGIKRVLLSPEMTLTQMEQLNNYGLETEVFAQGALQLMVSEHCALGALCGGRKNDGKENVDCSRPCKLGEKHFLVDEKGYRFPLRTDYACRMHIYNSREHCLLEEIPNLLNAGVNRFLLDIRLYEKQKANRILDLYLSAGVDRFSFEEAKRKLPSLIKEYTKGHLYRGV